MLVMIKNSILAIGCLCSIPLFAYGLPAVLLALR